MAISTQLQNSRTLTSWCPNTTDWLVNPLPTVDAESAFQDCEGKLGGAGFPKVVTFRDSDRHYTNSQTLCNSILWKFLMKNIACMSVVSLVVVARFGGERQYWGEVVADGWFNQQAHKLHVCHLICMEGNVWGQKKCLPHFNLISRPNCICLNSTHLRFYEEDSFSFFKCLNLMLFPKN